MSRRVLREDLFKQADVEWVPVRLLLSVRGPQIIWNDAVYRIEAGVN